MDVIAVEQVVAARLAGFTGLELDFNVFRGAFPENLSAALAVAAASETVTVESALKSADLNVFAEFADREKALAALDDLLTALPDYECSGLAALLPAGPARIGTVRRDGVVRFTFELTLTAVGF